MIVYIHKTKDSDTIFYVGISYSANRASLKKRRNPIWTNIYNKHGRVFEIIAEGLSREEACEFEKSIIKQYGKRIDGTGILANITDGGDQFNHCSESKKKMSDIANKRSKELLLKIKEKIPKGSNHYMARTVRNKITGKKYGSIKEAAESENINYKRLRKLLSGEIKTNNSNIEYY